jgi:hypothetical protein
MQGENLRRLPTWFRHALIGLGLFLAGAILAFGYSYRPLHGALTWQVDQLEERLDERNRENVELSDLMARQKSNAATRIDPDTLAQVEKELEQTKRVLNQAEKDLKRAKRKHKESASSASTWRKRFEELRDTSAAVAENAPSPIEKATAGTPLLETAPAAPAAPSHEADRSSASDGSQQPLERGILWSGDPPGPTTR